MNYRPVFLAQPLKTDANTGKHAQARAVNSVEEFEQLVKQGKADISTARLFLENSQKRLEVLPFEERRNAAAKVGAGRVLSWLWTSRGENTRQDDLDRQFSRALCWHLTAEGKENFIWDWLRIETANFGRRSADTYWHGRLLEGLVNARLCWDRSADGAIALFLSAVKEFDQTMHVVQATELIVKALRSIEGVVQCNDTSFEAFCEAMKFAHNGLHLERIRASLKMFHPTQVDAGEALRLFQRQYQYPDQYPKPIRVQPQRSQAVDMSRAAFILRLKGQRQDAEWLDARVYALYASVVSPGFVNQMYRTHHADPRLKMLIDNSPYAEEVLEVMKQRTVAGSSRSVEEKSSLTSPEPVSLTAKKLPCDPQASHRL